LEALGDAAGPSRISVVDAPVSGTADDVRQGGLTVLLGGEADAVRRCEPVLAAYADPIITVGPPGAAMKAKLLNNVLFAAQIQLVAQVADLAERLGLDPMSTLQSLLRCSAASAAMKHMARAGDIAAFAANAGPYLRKDVRACETTARELSLNLGLLGDVVQRGALDIA
jgi:3-hydroxyisobutyrate dehydrogenase-like beta-hydroxyacid dehydrogenase